MPSVLDQSPPSADSTSGKGRIFFHFFKRYCAVTTPTPWGDLAKDFPHFPLVRYPHRRVGAISATPLPPPGSTNLRRAMHLAEQRGRHAEAALEGGAEPRRRIEPDPASDRLQGQALGEQGACRIEPQAFDKMRRCLAGSFGELAVEAALG